MEDTKMLLAYLFDMVNSLLPSTSLNSNEFSNRQSRPASLFPRLAHGTE